MKGRPIHVHPRPKWLFPLLAAGCVALGVLFAFWGSAVLAGQFATLDGAVRDASVDRLPVFLTRFFQFVSTIGSSKFLVFVGAIVGWFLIPRRRWWMPLLFAGTWVVGEFVNWLKTAYEVKRPLGGLLTQDTHSFPSGHAAGAAVICVFLAYVAVRHRVRPWIFAPAAALVAMLVGVSRVMLDKHWASDVAGGWVVGAAFGAAFAALYDWTLRYHRVETPSSVTPPAPGATSAPS